MARRRRQIESDHQAFSLQTGEPIAAVQARMGIAMERLANSILEELEFGDSGTLDDRDSPGSEDPFLEATLDDIHSYCGIGEDRSRTPWGCNAMENRGYYTVDTGHTYVVKPRDENADPDSQSVRRVEDFIELWMTENDWANRQQEVCHRLDQHGEVFDLMRYDTDGMLRLAYVEPTDLENDRSLRSSSTMIRTGRLSICWESGERTTFSLSPRRSLLTGCRTGSGWEISDTT